MKYKLAVFATLASSVHFLHADTITWADITGNTNWTADTSWVGGVAPANTPFFGGGDVAIFTSVANAQPYLDVTGIRGVNGIDFQLPAGGLNFTSDAGATLRLGATGIDATTQLSGESIVGVTNIRVEGDNHTWTLFSNTANSSTSTFSVSSNIDLNGKPLTVRSDRNSAGNNVGIVNLSGAISGSANFTMSSPSAVRNTINLTGNSSYSGTTTITQVAVTANSLANGGNNSALGSSGDVILGTNAAVANLTFQNLSVDGSTDRLLLLKGTAASNPYILANNDEDNTIAFTNAGNTGDINVSYAEDLIFGLGGTNTGNNTFGQVINDRSGAGKTILLKEGSGTWALTNSNTYTGTTIVNNGVLRLDNAGALPGTSVLELGGTGGVLGLASGNFTRTHGTAAGEFYWSGSGGFAAYGADRTVNVQAINWSTTTLAGKTLILGAANSDAMLIWASTLSFAGGDRTVRVDDGSAAIDARFNGKLTSGGTFNKTGSGVLSLNNANNDYTAATVVSAGVLRIDNAAALGSGNLKLDGGILGLAAGDLTTRTLGTGVGQVQWTSSGGFAAFGGDRTVSFGTPGTSINWTVTNFIGDGNTLILGHEAADGTLIWDQTLNLEGATRFVQVNNGTADIDAKMSRSISGGLTGSVLNDFRKTGDGTLAFTANNFYWGETYVDAGTLMIGDGGSNGGVSRNSLDIIVASGATLAANRSNTLTQGTNDQLKVAISGDGGFAQLGSGNTVLTLANVYTGPTTVAAGTLTLGASDVLPDTSAVSIGSAILDTANGVAETTGTLAVTDAATINLGTGATLVFADSNLEDWTGGTLNITGDFTDTSIKFATSGGLTSGQLAVISVNGSGTGTYTLDASGFLVAGGTPYDTWADSKGLTGLPGSSTDPAQDADPDKDGRNNLAEFAFNGDPLSGSDNGKVFVLTEDSDSDVDATQELILTIAVRTGTPAFNDSPSPSANNATDGITYSIEGSLDLASFPTTVNVVSPVTTGLPPAGDGYEYRSFSLDGSNGLTGKGFLRAKVTSP